GSSILTVINIHTGKPASTIPIPYPYHLYFTPDGTKAINVVERQQRVEFRDWRHGWKLLKSVGIPWPGADHLDFSADGSYFMISTEYSGIVAKVDVNKMQLAGYVTVGGLPIDVKLSPDGTRLWASGRYNATVYVFDTTTGKVIAKIPVGAEDHGLTYFPNVGAHSLGHNGVYR